MVAIDSSTLATVIGTATSFLSIILGKAWIDIKAKADVYLKDAVAKTAQFSQLLSDIEVAEKDPAVTQVEVNQIISDAKLLISKQVTTTSS